MPGALGSVTGIECKCTTASLLESNQDPRRDALAHPASNESLTAQSSWLCHLQRTSFRSQPQGTRGAYFIYFSSERQRSTSSTILNQFSTSDSLCRPGVRRAVEGHQVLPRRFHVRPSRQHPTPPHPFVSICSREICGPQEGRDVQGARRPGVVGRQRSDFRRHILRRIGGSSGRQGGCRSRCESGYGRGVAVSGTDAAEGRISPVADREAFQVLFTDSF